MDNIGFVKNLRILSVIGIFLSTYATYVELQAEWAAKNDNTYSALCDISPHISCTAVFKSVYGRGFGVLQSLFHDPNEPWNPPPNGEIGIIFYTFMFISSLWHNMIWLTYLWLFLAVLSNLLSIYLAFLLYFVLESFCFICVAIYVINYFCLKMIWRIHKNNKIQRQAKSVNNSENSKDLYKAKEH